MRLYSLSRWAYRLGLLTAIIASFILIAPDTMAIAIVPQCARSSVISSTNTNGSISYNSPPPDLNCAILTFRNIATLIVGITGSAALFMFVYGGFMLLTSGGIEARVTKGKEIIKNALIGIVLVFTAGYIIDYAVQRLTTGQRVVQEGEVCADGLGAYHLQTGGAVCRINCQNPSLKSQHYQCMNGDEGQDCYATSNCGTGQQCCIAPEDVGGPAPASTDTNTGTDTNSTQF